jgi:hypothetical protein
MKMILASVASNIVARVPIFAAMIIAFINLP